MLRSHKVLNRYQSPLMRSIAIAALATLLLAAFALSQRISPTVYAARAIPVTHPVSLQAESAPRLGSSGTTLTQKPAASPTAKSETVTTTATVTSTAVATATVPANATLGLTANIPVSLTIPALSWSVPITPMGWENTIINEQITTRWVVPLNAAGWAVNSAAAGEAGNLIIAGQQTLGAGLFRPIALGAAEKGQEIWIKSADGRTHVYRITEESTPITAIGATAEDDAKARSYLAPVEQPRLTIVTGWPADTSTHRIFVVAEYVGVKK